MAGFLIVESERLVARGIARALPPGEAVVIVYDAAAAEKYVSSRRTWKGFIVDVGLGGGSDSGFDVLASIIEHHPNTPALLLAGQDNPEWDARARSLGLELLKKPVGGEAIRRFADRARVRRSAPTPEVVPSGGARTARRGRIVVAEDDESLTPNLCRLLEQEGFAVTSARTQSLRDAVARLEPGAAVLTNLSLRAVDGHDEMVEALRRDRPDLSFVVGARSFGIVGAIMRAANARWLEASPEIVELRARLLAALGHEIPPSERERPVAFRPSGSAAPSSMERVYELADRIAKSPRAPALLVGESGVGKEVIATRIHETSARRSAPFVRLNLAAISDGMLEAELFGSVRGAFTDAKRDRKGLVASADGGTLLLDEIGECRVEVQAKLLRVIENRTFFPVGSDQERSVDVRIIAATNRPPADVPGGGTFRTDLLFRLGTVIAIPPLRERRDEIMVLAERFAREACAESGRRTARFSRAARNALEAYDWPGNVRELKHAVERAVMLTERAEIDVDALELRPRSATPPPMGERGLADVRASAERAEIQSALEAAGGSPTIAARKLGISRSTLYEKLKRHGLR